MMLLGPWTIEASRFAVGDTQQERELEPLLFRLLQYFLAHPQRVIARQELADQVWQQAYVDDNAINRAISDLRKVLQHPLLDTSVLKTHHRKGYSLQWNAALQQQFTLSQAKSAAEAGAGSTTEDATGLQQPESKFKQVVGQSQPTQHSAVAEPVANVPAKPTLWSRRSLWLLILPCLALCAYVVLTSAKPAGPIVPTPTPTAQASGWQPPQQLSWAEGMASTPLLSSDKRLLAYSQFNSPQQAKVIVQLYSSAVKSTSDHSGSEAVSLELADHHLQAQNWQPGRAVLLVQAQHRQSGKCSYRLYDFSAYPAYQQQQLEAKCSPGSKVRALLAGDGQMLYRSELEPQQNSVHLVQEELATGQQQVLVNSRGTAMGLMDFSLSPDGRQLAYVRLDSSKTGLLYLYDLTTQEQRQLASFQQTGMVLQLAFSPAGDYLYGLNGLELVRVRLSDLRVQKQPLPAGFEAGELHLLDDQSAVVSEVSARLAGRTGSMQVVQLDHLFDEQQRKLSWFWQGKGSVAAVTPNPAQPDSFAFALLQGQGWQIWLREAGQDKQLTELASSNEPINHISWSPDGKQLVFSHKKILWLYQLEQQKLTQLLPQAEFLYPVFDPSGDSLVVQRDLNKQQQIWRVQLPSGQLQRLGLNQGSVPQFDQGQLYYYRGNQLMRYVDGGKGDQVLSTDAGGLLTNFRLSQGWVHYFVHDKAEFRRFPVHQTDAVEKLPLHQLQLTGKGMPMTLTLQSTDPEQVFINMMMYPQLHLYLLRWPAFPD